MRTGSQRGGWGARAAGRKTKSWTESLTGNVTAPCSFFLDPALPLPTAPRQCLSLPGSLQAPLLLLPVIRHQGHLSVPVLLVDAERGCSPSQEGAFKIGLCPPKYRSPAPPLGPTVPTPSNRAGLGCRALRVTRQCLPPWLVETG